MATKQKVSSLSTALCSFTKRIHTRTPEINVPRFTNKRFTSVEEFDEVSQKVIRKSVMKPIDRISEMQNYSVNDFSLDNMLSIGAPLTPCVLRKDNLSSVDSINRTLSNINITNNN